MTVSKINADNLFRETASYIVRPYSKGDKQAWVEANTEAEEKDFVRLLQETKDSQRKDKAYYFAVIFKSNNKIVATTSLSEIIRAQYQSAFLAISTNEKQIGDQVCIESLSATMDIAFNELNLHRLEILLLTPSRLSKTVLQNMGLKSEGIRRSCLKVNDRWEDVEVFAINKEEWKTKHISALMNTSLQMR